MKKKKQSTYVDEINLFDLFIILWEGKWIIIALTLIVTLISVGYYNLKPINYKVSTNVKQGDDSAFIKYVPVQRILQDNALYKSLISNKIENSVNEIKNPINELHYNLNAYTVFHLFVAEFNDLEEVIQSLEDSGVVDHISDNRKKKKVLYSLAKSFRISPPNVNKNLFHWTLSYSWNDVAEGRELIKKALSNTLMNTKKIIYSELNEILKIIDIQKSRRVKESNDALERYKKIINIKRDKEILYLREQSTIAKELGIEMGSIDNNSFQVVTNNTSEIIDIKNNTSGVIDNVTEISSLALDIRDLPTIPYYLRGYRAIDKEIELIISRSLDSQILMDINFLKITETINRIEGDLSSKELKKMLKILEDDNPYNWIEYNFMLADVELKKELHLVLKILLGLVIGVLYIFISNSIRSYKNSSIKIN